MIKFLLISVFALLAEGTIAAYQIEKNRNLSDIESSGTVLDDDMSEDIQAEEEEEEVSDEKAKQRDREIQSDEHRNPTNTRLNRPSKP